MNDAAMAGGDSSGGDSRVLSRISTRREKERDEFERTIKRMFDKQFKQFAILYIVAEAWSATLIVCIFSLSK